MNKRIFVIAFLISLFFIVFTSYTFFLEIPYNAKRLVEGFLLVVGGLAVVSSPKLQEQWFAVLKRLKVKRSFLVKVGISIVIIGFISAFLAPFTNWAFLEIAQYLLLFNLIVLFTIAYLNISQWFEKGFLSVLGLTAGLYLVNVIISYSYHFFIPNFPIWPSTDFIRIWFEGTGFRYPEPFSNFINRRFFNHLQTWSLPLLTLLVLYIPKRYWAFSKISFVITSGWWMLAFASGARGTLLASFLTLAFTFFMYKDKAKKWLRTYSISASIGLALYIVFFKFLPINNSTGLTFMRTNSSGRFEVWEYAFRLIVQNPFFGVGPMHYAVYKTEVLVAAPHNIYLQFFTEWGIIAGILFLGVVAVGCYKWFTQTNKVIHSSPPDSDKVNIRVALTASLMAGLIHGLFSGIINTPLSQIMMVLLLAWMIGLSVSGKKKNEPQTVKSWKRYSLVGVSLLAAGFLVWSYATHIPNLKESRYKFIKVTQSYRLAPRYWDQGIIGLEKADENKQLKVKSSE